MFSLTRKATSRCMALRHDTPRKVFAPRVRIVLRTNNKADVECAEKRAARSAMTGLLAAYIGEICFEGNPGITHQLALECHTTSYIAYFLIVFTAAFDVEKMSRYLPHAFRPESYRKTKKTSLFESVELICGRTAMILFVFFFLNGIHNHGFAHEVGPLQQIAEIVDQSEPTMTTH